METIDWDKRLAEIRADRYRWIAEFEAEHKGTWTACRYDREPHADGFNEYGWCSTHQDPESRCRIYPNGGQFICAYHKRYFGQREICPGLQAGL